MAKENSLNIKDMTQKESWDIRNRNGSHEISWWLGF